MLKRILVIIGLAVLATACSNAPRTVSHQVISENDDIQLTGLINNLEKDNRTGIFHKVRTNRSSALMGDKALASVYNEWVGTRYRMGGTTKRGIDCSAFMQTTFSDVFFIVLKIHFKNYIIPIYPQRENFLYMQSNSKKHRLKPKISLSKWELFCYSTINSYYKRIIKCLFNNSFHG